MVRGARAPGAADLYILIPRASDIKHSLHLLRRSLPTDSRSTRAPSSASHENWATRQPSMISTPLRCIDLAVAPRCRYSCTCPLWSKTAHPRVICPSPAEWGSHAASSPITISSPPVPTAHSAEPRPSAGRTRARLQSGRGSRTRPTRVALPSSPVLPRLPARRHCVVCRTHRPPACRLTPDTA